MGCTGSGIPPGVRTSLFKSALIWTSRVCVDVRSGWLKHLELAIANCRLLVGRTRLYWRPSQKKKSMEEEGEDGRRSVNNN